MRLKLFLFLNSLLYRLLIVPTKTTTKNKVVRTASYVPKSHSQVLEDQSGLDRAIVQKYVPYVFGSKELYPAHVRPLLDTWPASQLAELAVAKLFDVPLEPAFNQGYDLDTTGLKLGGRSYGKIEVRSRSLQSCRSRGYKRYRFPIITEDEMRRKAQVPADWYFAVCWDSLDEKLVWFRIPKARALRNQSLTVNKGVDGGYGWADEYLWDGPC